ncbi:MAG: hypothetical protein LBD06_09555 [Candidatus Accumulibacter sp.]|nr:hypothetical protein [Accumulibacter sp.]
MAFIPWASACRTYSSPRSSALAEISSPCPLNPSARFFVHPPARSAQANLSSQISVL